MEEKISETVKILQVLKEIFSPRSALFTGLIIYFLLYAPSLLNLHFGYENLINPYRAYISLAGTTLLLFGLIYPASAIRTLISRRRVIHLSFSGLTLKEKFLIAYCVKNQEKTVMISVDDPVIMSLSTKGIFSRQGAFRGGMDGSVFFFPFSINEPFWTKLLKGKIKTLTKEQIESEDFQQFCEKLEENQAGQSRQVDI